MARLLLLTHKFWPSEGGTQRLAYNLGTRLAKRGYDVSVFTSTAGSSDNHEWVDGMQIHRFRRQGHLPARPWYVTPGMFSQPIWSKYDILHSFHFVTFQSLLAASIRRVTRRPLVMTPSFHPWHGVYEDVIGAWVIRSADQVIAQCQQERRNLLAFVDKERVVTVPCGIDSSKFRSPVDTRDFDRKHGLLASDKVILYVGAMSRHKGVPDLINCMPRVLQRVPNAKLLLVGGASFSDAKQVIELGKSNVVRHLGKLSEDELVGAYFRADVFALPSRDESFGIVLVEAAAAGLPIVSTRSGVAEELITNGSTGYVVDSCGPTFASRLIEVILNEGFHENARRRRFSLMASFDWDLVTTSVENIYRSQLKKKN